MLYKMIIIKKF